MEYIPFEKPIAELEIQIAELNRVAITQAINLDKEMEVLEEKSLALRKKMFSKLTAYEITQLSRHPKRPNTLDYINLISSDFTELHGDRNYYDDPAIVGGLAVISGISVVIIGHQKGRGTKDNIYRNFGMPTGFETLTCFRTRDLDSGSDCETGESTTEGAAAAC